MRWSRPDILNATRDVSRYMGEAQEHHLEAVHRIMKFVVDTPERGIVFKAKEPWNGKDKSYIWRISGTADSEYAKMDPVSDHDIRGSYGRLVLPLPLQYDTSLVSQLPTITHHRLVVTVITVLVSTRSTQ